MSDIEELRDRIDELTLEMMRLLGERTEAARKIGMIKRSSGRGVTDEQREEALRAKVAALCGKTGLDGLAASRLLSVLIGESIRVQSDHTSGHLSMFRRARDLESQGKKIIHMEIGEPDFGPPDVTREALADACRLGHTGYGDVRGMAQLREGLALHASRKFKARVGAQNTMVTPGARFGVYLAITTLLGPGDELLVIEPAWSAYRDCATNAGVKVRAVRTSLERNWEPTPDEIQDAIGPNTKMIALNYPNNPTGKVLQKESQDGIMSAARDANLYVLSDEIYSEYAYGPWRSALEYGYDKTIITQSFSKSHAMTGFRIGYTVASESALDSMARLQALCLTSVAEPVQYAALRSLDFDASSNSALIRDRLKLLSEHATKAGLEFARPDGAMYLFARLPRGHNGTDLANSLLEYGLAVAPGEGFGPYQEFIRISACQKGDDLVDGMNILGRTLEGAS